MWRQSSVKSDIFPAVFGQGRSIPLKQGLLSKKCAHSWMSGEWVPKYVTLTGGGQLAYFPSLSAYLDSTSGKEIRLHTATVKIPGQNPTGVKCGAWEQQVDILETEPGDDDKDGEIHDSDYEDKCFEIISLFQQRWVFACGSRFERDEWVRAIEVSIGTCLRGVVGGTVLNRVLDPAIGNTVCVDCGDNDPEWASVNLGIVMCIECSGIHRNLGSHVSQVRSLFLDCLSEEQVTRLTDVGNGKFNQERETDQVRCFKPSPRDHRGVKEKFIVRKYKDFSNYSDGKEYII